ncbi:hypothetical protein KUCAC02_006309, partial [Chaenocephalus aceratus]
TLCSRLQGGEETGLGSSDGKVGQRSQPSTGELLKRPGEMMSWTLSFPPLCSPPPLTQQRRSQQQELSQALAKLLMHIRETHDTDDFMSSNKDSIHQKLE